MPIYRYNGFRTDGTEVSGMIEASGLNDAVSKIRAEEILPSRVTEPVRERTTRLFKRTDDSFLPGITRQLSVLLASGVPLIEAVNSLASEQKGPAKEMLIAIKESLAGGASLSRALADSGGGFPVFYVSMIEAGEESGALDKVLVRLADYLENQSAVRARVRSAMVYPLFMTGVSIVVLSFLFTFVIPKIVKIFADAKSALPLITTILIFISRIFVSYWWAILAIAAIVLYAGRKLAVNQRMFIDGLLLKAPGSIMQPLYYARFSRTLGFLVGGGLPILRALGLSSRAIGNRVLEASVLEAERKVAEGAPLASSVENFSPMLVQLIATGEKSGKLAETLNRAADAYEEQFSRNVQKSVALFEPLLVLVMGAVVLFIVLAVLLPIFQLNQLIK